jgi:hypothetical protein
MLLFCSILCFSSHRDNTFFGENLTKILQIKIFSFLHFPKSSFLGIYTKTAKRINNNTTIELSTLNFPLLAHNFQLQATSTTAQKSQQNCCPNLLVQFPLFTSVKQSNILSKQRHLNGCDKFCL